MRIHPDPAEIPDLGRAAAAIVAARLRVPRERAALVAISGIDGAGKGYVTARLARTVERWGLRVATLGVDPWLEPAHTTFGGADPCEFFYRSVARIEDKLATVVPAIRDRRTEDDGADVILLEGIFLLRREFRPLYDLAIWVDCSFETALGRAVARAQEGLPPAETERAYRTIYFPAQARHIVRDDPMRAAGIVIENDEARRNGTRLFVPSERSAREPRAGTSAAAAQGRASTTWSREDSPRVRSRHAGGDPASALTT